MCRLLLISSVDPFDPSLLLEEFARACAISRIYQGHGWGAAWRERSGWRTHRHIEPIWQEPRLPVDSVRHLVVHARSAFRDEGVELQNNMPFVRGEEAFVFNGELHGVRLSVPGRIGAERIFELTRRLGHARARAVLVERTRRILGMNWIVVDQRRARVASMPGEDPDYYTMHVAREARRLVVCSVPLSSVESWRPIEPGIMEVPLCTSSRSVAANR